MPDESNPKRIDRIASAAEPVGELGEFDLGLSLAEVTRLLRLAFDQRVRHLELTGATWRVIAYLSNEDGQTQASLARRLEMSPAALGEAVGRLERSGHVERRADPNDRRKWRVHLTEKSKTLLPSLFAIAREMSAEYFSTFSRSEVMQLQSILQRLCGRLFEMKIEK
jgi:MarR family transcriptional regulator, transcriptional regulator for hemolysin